jgi:hypothetical protein
MKRFVPLQFTNRIGDTEYTEEHGLTRIQFSFTRVSPFNPCPIWAVCRLFSEQFAHVIILA